MGCFLLVAGVFISKRIQICRVF